MKLLLMTIFLTFLSLNVAAVKLFDCEKPVGPFSSDFQQGDELFLDVLLNDEGMGELKIFRLYGKELILPLVDKEGIRANLDGGTFTMRWQNGYLSMVYLGGKTWGGFVSQKTYDLIPKENEFLCQENDLSIFE